MSLWIQNWNAQGQKGGGKGQSGGKGAKGGKGQKGATPWFEVPVEVREARRTDREYRVWRQEQQAEMLRQVPTPLMPHGWVTSETKGSHPPKYPWW